MVFVRAGPGAHRGSGSARAAAETPTVRFRLTRRPRGASIELRQRGVLLTVRLVRGFAVVIGEVQMTPSRLRGLRHTASRRPLVAFFIVLALVALLPALSSAWPRWLPIEAGWPDDDYRVLPAGATPGASPESAEGASARDRDPGPSSRGIDGLNSVSRESSSGFLRASRPETWWLIVMVGFRIQP